MASRTDRRSRSADRIRDQSREACGGGNGNHQKEGARTVCARRAADLRRTNSRRDRRHPRRLGSARVQENRRRVARLAFTADRIRARKCGPYRRSRTSLANRRLNQTAQRALPAPVSAQRNPARAPLRFECRCAVSRSRRLQTHQRRTRSPRRFARADGNGRSDPLVDTRHGCSGPLRWRRIRDRFTRYWHRTRWHCRRTHPTENFAPSIHRRTAATAFVDGEFWCGGFPKTRIIATTTHRLRRHRDVRSESREQKLCALRRGPAGERALTGTNRERRSRTRNQRQLTKTKYKEPERSSKNKPVYAASLNGVS